ncbi:MAG: Crp/Fnr family transcriptional regulator [Sphingomonas sp.]|jgi:CRP/FNR family transcriptional regulator|nr:MULTISPECIES: Crp/Fnr family transcriptional regulator [unclassified Sphingomonas]MDR6847102.1 CRP/FNR family transcriptional regulator [Sphingomonas sp. BE137]MDR7256703.1 CRP/FNR family transcriptional regulator [Sphingomonas sp. BE270]
MGTLTNRCAECDVRDMGLCGAADIDELSSLSAIGRRRAVAAGQVLTWAGDDNVVCANVVSGILKVTASTSDGREQIVGLVFGGDFVGQLFEETSSLTVTALVDSDLCVYPRERFERVVAEVSAIERTLLRRTVASLNEARERMLTLGKRGAQERVAGFLLDLVDRTGVRSADGSLSIDVPVSRGDMADFLGLTIETVSRQLTRLKVLGAVTLARGGRAIVVSDRAALEALANPD